MLRDGRQSDVVTMSRTLNEVRGERFLLGLEELVRGAMLSWEAEEKPSCISSLTESSCSVVRV